MQKRFYDYFDGKRLWVEFKPEYHDDEGTGFMGRFHSYDEDQDIIMLSHPARGGDPEVFICMDTVKHIETFALEEDNDEERNGFKLYRFDRNTEEQ